MLRLEEVKAHVEDGQLVLDEPLSFPNGTRLRIVPEEEEAMSSDIEAAWIAEAKRRFAEYDAGKMKSASWAEARERIFSKP